MRPESIKPVVENPTKSKRGRKTVVLETYQEDAEKNISKWKKEIVKQAKNEDEKLENQKLRNKISALKSRVSKKTELNSLE